MHDPVGLMRVHPVSFSRSIVAGFAELVGCLCIGFVSPEEPSAPLLSLWKFPYVC